MIVFPVIAFGLVTAVIGVVYSVIFWRDRVLLVISLLMLFTIFELVTEAGPVDFYNWSFVVTGVLILILEANWFLLRRKRQNN